MTEIANADNDPLIPAWWDDFLVHVPPLLEGKKYVETTLSATLNRRRLAAKFDLILISPSGKLVIFDWKTSRKEVRKDWLLDRIQTRLYRMVLTLAGGTLTDKHKISPDRIEMNYWFAPHPKTPVTLPYDEEQFQADIDFFSHLIDEIQKRPADAFEKTSDFRKCRYCIYRSHCDRGTSAGELEAFDDFALEPTEETPNLEYDEIEEIAF